MTAPRALVVRFARDIYGRLVAVWRLVRDAPMVVPLLLWLCALVLVRS